MLHIILFILKILGLLLAGILALLILIILYLLFSPVVYRLEASGADTPESVKGELRFRWLTNLLSGRIIFDSGEASWTMRVAWKRFGSDRKPAAQKAVKRKSAPEPEPRPERKKEQAGAPVRPAETAPRKPASCQPKEDPAEKKEKKEKPSLYERLTGFWEKIKYTFQKICDKIRTLTDKKDKLRAFICDEVHKSAFLRVLKELLRFLKTLRPKKADIYLKFGFSNPAWTGYTLAAASMLWPAVGEYTRLEPDFEHRTLGGRIYVKGRIRAVHVVAMGLRVLADRNVRTTYRHIRNFKL